MPEMICPSVHGWGRQIIDHAVRTGHPEIEWAVDPLVARELCIRCTACNERFTLTLRDLLRDRDPHADIMRDAVRTHSGRQNALAALRTVIRQEAEKRAATPYRTPPSAISGSTPEPARVTAWERLLEDDDSV